ncbi:uncharacterized protein HMPREF1541_01424 [Cyphellophora europaea CBS 101466]|uniref:F-box domain-containing protein n=1 Tax=Cyphellophora europaea (strain CBS 101466) TaxID=1220924 RepID=W2SEW1_CYPE1|nr:uncharacterized protein HMPREF1541_01424 [Cyphellophora europaea CBS 101466]ETN47232.1 hypothetical protein HMPREF1541_01424 [Cyphellophora europaea CBS 101466]
MEQLPTELLENVLQNLNQLSLVRSQQVCRRWDALVKSSTTLRLVTYQSAKADQQGNKWPTSPSTRLNPLLSGPSQKPDLSSAYNDFEDDCDNTTSSVRETAIEYPDEIYGVVATASSVYTMLIPHFKQRIAEVMQFPLTDCSSVPSWMSMHVFHRQCKLLSITVQSLSSPGELQCLTVENPQGVRLGNIISSMLVDQVQ